MRSGLEAFEPEFDAAGEEVQELRRRVVLMVAKTPAGAIAKFATLAAEYRDDPVDPGALTGNKPLTADHVLTSAARDCARLISSAA